MAVTYTFKTYKYLGSEWSYMIEAYNGTNLIARFSLPIIPGVGQTSMINTLVQKMTERLSHITTKTLVDTRTVSI